MGRKYPELLSLWPSLAEWRSVKIADTFTFSVLFNFLQGWLRKNMNFSNWEEKVKKERMSSRPPPFCMRCSSLLYAKTRVWLCLSPGCSKLTLSYFPFKSHLLGKTFQQLRIFPLLQLIFPSLTQLEKLEDKN